MPPAPFGERCGLSPPHIGIVLPNLGGGGAERAMLTLAGSLVERGYRVDLVLLRLAGPYRAAIPDGVTVYYHLSRALDPELARYVRARGIGLRPLHTGPVEAFTAWRSLRRRFPRAANRVSRLRAALGVACYIREAKPDLLLSALQLANDASVLAAAIADRTVPLVVSLRNNVALRYSARQLSLALELTPEADAVVAISKGVAAGAVETLGLDPRQVHTIYNPTPLQKIRHLAAEGMDHPWFDGKAPQVILSVLKRGTQKDYTTLIRALDLVRNETPARLVILGGLSKAHRGEVMALAGSLGVADDVALLGFDENPFRYMRRAALFVLSSRYEGLANVLIEAMACGTPVVSTDAPYGPAEILEGGRWGRLTPIGDAKALATAIVDTLEKAIPAEALRRRADDFSAERAVAAYVALFDSLIDRNAQVAVTDGDA
ncbi:MAG: glycosyltransferase [Chloroflexi bacterium]|nr:glycosyltransferase [Chloroflexota bacterium]